MSVLVRLLLRPLNQEVPRSNARQGAARLAQERREREDVDAFLAELSGDSRLSEHARH
ncbi:MAG: hypothetical protein ACJ72A_09680 [Nocardioidaceae bacterium]